MATMSETRLRFQKGRGRRSSRPTNWRTWLEAQGAKTVAMNHGGWCEFPFGRVRFTIAFHSSSMIEDGGRPLYLGEAAGVVLQTEGKTIYHAGDTALFRICV